MMNSSGPSIFDIPLILDLIAVNLSRHRILQCVRVCKAWHEAFSPYYWQSVCVYKKCALKRFRSGPARLAIRAYRAYIRSLTTYHGELFHYLLPTLPLNKQERKLERRRQRQQGVCQTQEDNNPTKESTDCGNTNINDTLINLETSMDQFQLSPTCWVSPPAFVSTLASSSDAFVFGRLTSIKSVSIFQKWNNINNNVQHLHCLFSIVELCPHLRSFETDAVRFTPGVMDRLTAVIWEHPTLKDFKMVNSEYVPVRLLHILLLHCMRLEKLTLGCIVYGRVKDEPLHYNGSKTRSWEDLASLPDADIKELDMGHLKIWSRDPETLISFLQKCPRLRRWTVPIHSVLDGVADVIGKDLTELCWLDFSSCSDDDNKVAEVVRACHVLEGFKGHTGNFSRIATINALLESHRMLTLREVYLTGCRQMTGAQIQQILTSCHNLFKFHAMGSQHLMVRYGEDPFLRAEDMEANSAAEWTCLGLKELSLRYEELSEEIFPEVVYNQIAKLTQLEVLSIERKCLPDMVGEGEGEEDQDVPLDETKDKNLASALQAFHSLLRLRQLELSNLEQRFYRSQRSALESALPRLERIDVY
ncbi:hypothetical protein BGX33_009363 [Mortierella sp. NVP41]|nr:hypothetical protein BGX33_009363 [Mortierella sp. NVP41]